MKSLTKLYLSHRARRFVYKFRNRPTIKSQDCVIGKNVVFGKNVILAAKKIRIGDGCTIGDNVQINGDVFEMGDYGTIYHDCFFPGGEVKIGHNFWLGVGSIVDGRAGTRIGNNVGIGAQSQLWTHMVYGDLLQGCRFHSERPLTIGNNVWLVGHNLVSPVNIEDRSMAMLGSLVTKDMFKDRTYAGMPAIDVTDKFGSQFQEISNEAQLDLLTKRLHDFEKRFGLSAYTNYIKLITAENGSFDQGTKLIQLNLATRTYLKTGSILEYYLIHFLLPDLKFLPAN